ncbi:MAG: 50S ribosomal protein L10 [Candidatus Staskawiczbacteria bacterium]|nr:50S ribosomal protein L10 [Candidatus Staskawiczbacteria bacterium]
MKADFFYGVYKRTNSKDMFGLRKKLKEAGCAFKVAKKTLVRRAFGQLNISFWQKMKENVPGQLALVFGIEDEISSAKISNDFSKKQENFKILGGLFENKFIEKDRVLELASIPPRNELLSRLVGSLQSPIASFARVLDKIRENKEKN